MDKTQFDSDLRMLELKRLIGYQTKRAALYALIALGVILVVITLVVGGLPISREAGLLTPIIGFMAVGFVAFFAGLYLLERLRSKQEEFETKNSI